MDPPPAFAALRAEASLVRVRIWDGSTPWLVTRYGEQRALLADPRVSADITRPGYPHGTAAVRKRAGRVHTFLNMDDPEHARQRRMVNAHFTARRAEKMRPAIQAIVDDAVDDLLTRPNPADLVAALALPVPSMVICRLLGVPLADQDFFQRRGRILADRNADDETHRQTQIELLGYLDELIEEKLAAPDDGLLSELVTERLRTGELTRRETAIMGLLMLAAGHETTANMIALGTLTLLRHPDQLAVLRRSEDDPRAVTKAVEELFRYISVVEGRSRVALEDIEIDGRLIRAGDGLIMPADLADRDPSVFENPERLDLAGHSHRHLALGFGTHQCLGQHLARTELEVVFSTLFRRIPTLSLAVDIAELRFRTEGLRGVHELPVAW
jgi:cytochrome P450